MGTLFSRVLLGFDLYEAAQRITAVPPAGIWSRVSAATSPLARSTALELEWT